MPGYVISRLILNEKLYKHLEELSIQSHITLCETIECVLYQEMVRSLNQKVNKNDS